MSALVERIEQADGPSRELDREIADTMGWTTLSPYTASLDSAMTLVPEGYALGFKRAPCQRSHAMLATIGYEANASGATPALALCAAVLKAREADHG